MTQLYTKINSRVYKPVGRYDDFNPAPADGFVFVHSSGWTVMPHTEGVTDIVFFTRIFCHQNTLCRALMSGTSGFTIDGMIAALKSLPVMDLNPVPCRVYDTPTTYYTKTKAGYKPHGLLGGFKGFTTTGLYFVKIVDGQTHEECVKLITDLKHQKSVYIAASFGKLNYDHIAEKITNLKLGYISTADVAARLLRLTYDEF